MDGMQGTSLLSWMAWTTPTALFFTFIACCLLAMTLWEMAVPGGDPRRGVLGLDTTRGDRLFISLLGSAFIHLAWLAAFGSNLWPAVAVSVVYALAVFRWV
jgi:predicted small integral membrane protein